MRLMLLITALVLGSFIILNAISRRKQKKHLVLNEDISNSTYASVEKMQHDLSDEQDPLLDDVTVVALTPINELEANKVPKEEIDVVQEEVSQSTEDPIKHQEFVTLTILPKHSGYFSESALTATLVKNHFCIGKEKLYHRHIQDNPQLPIMYSVGSLSKPGYFEFDLRIKKSFSGIFIYMALDVADPQQTFEKMLTCARQISASLNAQICDEKRDPLSTLALKKIKEKIKAQEAPQKELEVW